MNNMNKSDIDLAQLLKTFDPDTKSFKFGTKSFQITGNAVTQILGLPNEGKSVKLVNDRYTATFRTRHFGEKGKPSKNQVEAELQKTIALANQPKKEKAKTEQKKKTNKGKEKKEAEEEEEEEVDYDKEVVSLILILLCMTFLFANSSSTLHWKLFEHCVNLDTLSSYSWARAVSDYMNESLTAKAKAKAKKGGEASIGAVSGCTILILVSKQWLMQCILSFRQCSFHLVQCSFHLLQCRNGNCNAVSVLSYAVSNLISDISCF